MNRLATLTVLITVRNDTAEDVVRSEQTVRAHCLLAQRSGASILVVDDASPHKLVLRACDVIRMRTRVGQAAAICIGLRQTCTDAVLITDSGCLPDFNAHDACLGADPGQTNVWVGCYWLHDPFDSSRMCRWLAAAESETMWCMSKAHTGQPKLDLRALLVPNRASQAELIALLARTETAQVSWELSRVLEIKTAHLRVCRLDHLKVRHQGPRSITKAAVSYYRRGKRLGFRRYKTLSYQLARRHFGLRLGSKPQLYPYKIIVHASYWVGLVVGEVWCANRPRDQWRRRLRTTMRRSE